MADFTDKLLKELETYTGDVADKVKKLADQTIKELVDETKKDAPVRSGAYRESIASKTLSETRFSKSKIWYVKSPHYRLAHLLEDGHVKRNGGRVNAIPHIRKNAEQAIQKFEEGVEEIINETK